MQKVMLTITLDPSEASLERVKRQLQLTDDEIDKNFGVVRLSLDENLYAILVDEAAAAKVTVRPGIKGPYANPKIEPFGPPK